MGKYKNTKIILLLMLILLGLTSALRIKNRQEVDTASAQPTQEATPATDETTAPTTDNIDEQPNYFAAIESISFYETHVYSLEDTIANNGGESYHVTVTRALDGSTDDIETDVIQYTDETITDRVREEYRRVRDHFDFTSSDIYIFDTSFFIILSTERGDVTAETGRIVNFYGISTDYRDVNRHFNNEQESWTISDAVFIYYFNEDRDGVETREYNTALVATEGSYQVHAFPLTLRTILLKQPQDRDAHGTWFSYQFSLDLDNTELPTARVEGMTGLLPIHADLWSNDMRESWDNGSPQFQFNVSPTENQINVNLLLSLLDTENAIDQRVSPQLGEDDATPFDSNVLIPAPKGLDSFNHLPVSEAYFNVTNGGMDLLYIEPNCPDFSFLPLEMATTANHCQIVYVSSHNVAVRVEGQVTINGQTYFSFFQKLNDQNIYNITLFGEEGSLLSFTDIRNFLFSTMEVVYDSTVLTTDPESLQRLAAYGITEDATVIENPVIDVSYDTYLMYTVRGRFRAGGGLRNRVAFSADFINMDGAVFSYVRFFFNPSISARQFSQFFDITDGQDAGFQSFRILDFEIISVNRDFNTDLITQIRHSNLMIHQDMDVLTINGLSIVLATDLDYNCEQNYFCRMFKGFGVPSALNFTGVIGNGETILSADFSNFTLNDAADFESNTFSIHILPNENGDNSANLELSGQLVSLLEPDRAVRFDTIWTFPNDPSGNATLTGTKTSIYDNVFGIEIFDILEGRVNGEIDPITNIIQYSYTSTSVVGNDCYTHPEYIDMVIDDDNSLDSIIYNYDSSNLNPDGTLDVIDDTCVVGNSVFYMFSNDVSHNRYDTQFYFEGYENFIRTLFNTQPDDGVSLLVDSIDLPRGFTSSNVFRDANDRDYVEFYGTNDFLGILGYGQVQAYIENDQVNSTVYLPSFTLGGGNLQFLTDNEIQKI